MRHRMQYLFSKVQNAAASCKVNFRKLDGNLKYHFLFGLIGGFMFGLITHEEERRREPPRRS